MIFNDDRDLGILRHFRVSVDRDLHILQHFRVLVAYRTKLPPFSQALIAVLKIIVCCYDAAVSQALKKRADACCHCPDLSQALIAAPYAMTFGSKCMLRFFA